MTSLQLPLTISTNSLNSCVFKGDSLYIVSSMVGTVKFYKANTLEVKYKCFDANRSEWEIRISKKTKEPVLRKGVRNFYNATYHIFPEDVNIPDINKLEVVKQGYCTATSNRFICKNSILLAFKPGISSNALPAFPSQFSEIYRDLKKNTELLLYNYRTEVARVFSLEGTTVMCSVGDQIGAAVTKTKIYFFDLD